MRLTFLTFDLEPEDNCGYDFVQVFGGLEGSGGDYGSFCGTKVGSFFFVFFFSFVWQGREDLVSRSLFTFQSYLRYCVLSGGTQRRKSFLSLKEKEFKNAMYHTYINLKYNNYYI